LATALPWTNPSVIAFAGDQDPIEAIERRAREVVLQAFDKGWSGPPFDPGKLAEILNISIRPGLVRVLMDRHTLLTNLLVVTILLGILIATRMWGDE
jgi:hypothetical protein